MPTCQHDGSAARSIRGTLLIAAILCAGSALHPAEAQVTAFMEISGVQGDATEAGHEDWVTIVSFQHAISSAPSPMSTGTTGGRPATGRAMVGDVSIVKEIDKSRPSLMDACRQGSHFDEITIHVTEPGAGEYLVYTFERVAVVRYRILAARDTALKRYVGISLENPTVKLEEVTFGYSRVSWAGASEDDDEDDWRR